ncbi:MULTISPECIES: hypothetical protein [Mesorhizobium]|uniref:Uncharacterized protein n=1 Tax=Mesorhizobium opportunistum (strain LMG 24607 / HAMBI 3007 / WSM2075) TaxID=536019 RepID=F7Y5R5_MESOW|nr:MULTISPECIES: hypothetical protein [Mesorhizobium]AEH87390.1 hypothetical protein Mesop_2933 [Mesorhizobium opportunistum WSM2075]
MTKLSKLGPPIPGKLHGGEDSRKSGISIRAPILGKRWTSGICANAATYEYILAEPGDPTHSSEFMLSELGPPIPGNRREGDPADEQEDF